MAGACADQAGLPERPWLPMLFAPLVAVLLPLQTNFEHQNMNAVLLALLAGATWQLTLGSAAVAVVCSSEPPRRSRSSLRS